jgi:hypothetical protein
MAGKSARHGHGHSGLGLNGYDEAFRPYRQLAIRVLISALRDAASASGSAADRNSARAFLSDSHMFVHWCQVAALDPRSIAQRVGKLLGNGNGAASFPEPHG